MRDNFITKIIHSIESYSRSSAANEHGSFERAELFLGQQAYHLEVGIDHESHVIVVVIDPDLLPLAVVKLAPTVHLQFTDGAGVQSKIES